LGSDRKDIRVPRTVPELERAIGADALALGCTPIINLFQQRCEPISLTHTDTEYRIVPDARHSTAMEVWQVERVRETQAGGTRKYWRPFYRLTNSDADEDDPRGFYHAVRRETSSPAVTGSDVYLALHDPGFDPEAPADSVLSIDALCFNRDLPAALPFGAGRPELRLVEGSATVARVVCLTAPTPTLRRTLREHGFWHLVSSVFPPSVVGGERAGCTPWGGIGLATSRSSRTGLQSRHFRVSRLPELRVFRALRARSERLDVTLELSNGKDGVCFPRAC
jgi:type VI secretion system protein ImpG